MLHAGVCALKIVLTDRLLFTLTTLLFQLCFYLCRSPNESNRSFFLVYKKAKQEASEYRLSVIHIKSQVLHLLIYKRNNIVVVSEGNLSGTTIRVPNEKKEFFQ